MAHERGVVHRDLKPENVLFGEDGRPLIADLGLAKHFDREAPGASQSASLSQDGMLRGTVGYLAPEQAVDASSAGPPADVFALGALLYECLAGRPPFAGASVVEVLSAATAARFEPLRRARPDTPAWLAAVIERALAPEPTSRFRDGRDLERALVAGVHPGRRSRVVTVAAAGAIVAGVLAAAIGGRLLASGPGEPRLPSEAPTSSSVAAAPAPPPPPPRASDAPHVKTIRALAFVGEKADLLLASGGDDGRIVFTTPGGARPSTLQVNAPVHAFAFATSATFAFGAPATVTAVRQETGLVTRSWTTPGPAVDVAVMEHDSDLMIGVVEPRGGADWWIWGKDGGRTFPGMYVNPSVTMSAARLAFTAEGRPLAVFGYTNGSIDLRFLLDPSGSAAGAARLGAAVHHLAASQPLRRLAAADARGLLKIFDVTESDSTFVLKERLFRLGTTPMSALAIARDGSRAASAYPDGMVRLHDLAAHATTVVVPAGPRVDALAVSPDGALIAVARGVELSLWEASPPRLLWTKGP